MTPDPRVQEIRETLAEWEKWPCNCDGALEGEYGVGLCDFHLKSGEAITFLLSSLDARERRIEELEAKVADSWFEACAKERDEAHTLLGRLVEALEWYHMAGCTTHHQGCIACDALADARRALGARG